MANEQNLKPCEHKFTQEEAKKGARNSAKSRRNKKMLKDCLEMLLEKTENVEIEGKPLKLTGAEILAVAAFRKAASGDIKAMEFVRDTAGQKPVEKVQMKTDVNISDSADRLSDLFDQIKENK